MSIVVPSGGWPMRLQDHNPPALDVFVAAGTYTLVGFCAALEAAFNSFPGRRTDYTVRQDTMGRQWLDRSVTPSVVRTDPPTNKIIIHGLLIGYDGSQFGGFAVYFGAQSGDTGGTTARRQALRDALGYTDNYLIEAYGEFAGPPFTGANAGYYIAAGFPTDWTPWVPPPDPVPPVTSLTSLALALADVRVVWLDGTTDMAIVDDDVAADFGLRTSVLLSLFTDRRAEDDDVLPSDDDNRRGWWGDEFSAVEGDKIGSRLWLLDRSALRGDVAKRAEEFIREALAWMIEDQVTARIAVDVVATSARGLEYTVAIDRPQGDPVRFRFAHVWDATASEAP